MIDSVTLISPIPKMDYLQKPHLTASTIKTFKKVLQWINGLDKA